MKLATITSERTGAGREVGVVVTEAGAITLTDVNAHLGTDLPTDLFGLIDSGRLPELRRTTERGGSTFLDQLAHTAIPLTEVGFGPLYRHPRKIWGIGLNYVEHAADLAENAPTVYPGNFAKFDTTIIGPGDTIRIPRRSRATTAESELGVIFGARCRHVPAQRWLDVIAGFTTIIDMTAEDILRLNPRYLTSSKNFDTFFSFGPCLLTPDEIDDVGSLTVCTVVNGAVRAANQVANMTFPPDRLVEFQTGVATMLPGDIISTGTPGAVQIEPGDVVECRIDGFDTLVNPVGAEEDALAQGEALRRTGERPIHG